MVTKARRSRRGLHGGLAVMLAATVVVWGVVWQARHQASPDAAPAAESDVPNAAAREIGTGAQAGDTKAPVPTQAAVIENLPAADPGASGAEPIVATPVENETSLRTARANDGRLVAGVAAARKPRTVKPSVRIPGNGSEDGRDITASTDSDRDVDLIEALIVHTTRTDSARPEQARSPSTAH